jgi:hypothetical protein
VRPAGRQADHQRVRVDPAQPAEGLLRRAGDQLGPEVEEHQEVAEVTCEKGHLVGSGDQDPVCASDRFDRPLDVRPRDLPRRLLDVDVVGRQSRLEVRLVEREERRRRLAVPTRALRVRPPVFLTRGVLELGEPVEAERLREADDRRARRVRPTGELLRSLERSLIEVIDDVLGDVLLRP